VKSFAERIAVSLMAPATVLILHDITLLEEAQPKVSFCPDWHSLKHEIGSGLPEAGEEGFSTDIDSQWISISAS